MTGCLPSDGIIRSANGNIVTESRKSKKCNGAQFARKVLAFVFGMDKAIWRHSRPLDRNHSIPIPR